MINIEKEKEKIMRRENDLKIELKEIGFKLENDKYNQRLKIQFGETKQSLKYVQDRLEALLRKENKLSLKNIECEKFSL